MDVNKTDRGTRCVDLVHHETNGRWNREAFVEGSEAVISMLDVTADNGYTITTAHSNFADGHGE